MLRIPEELRDRASLGPAWSDWLDRLGGLTSATLEEWELTEDGPVRWGTCSLVLPVRTRAGAPAALKIGFPDDESAHEHLALQHWGDVAVDLLRADPRRRLLLLERLDPTDLSDLWDLEACEVVAGLYGELHVPAPPQLWSLAVRTSRWVDALAALPRDAPLPRRLVEQATSLGRDLAADERTDGTMVHTDLHYANVLAGGRRPWVVIDPKPLSGDPHFEPAPMLWNRWDDVVAGGSVRDAVRRRFHTLVDTARLDEDRARAWVVVRMVVNAMEELAGRRPDRDWVTRCVTVAKAVQD